MATLPHSRANQATLVAAKPAILPTATSTKTNFAFLVHSQDSIQNNAPPNIDNKPLVRQRRRRTSPEDQQILESEFNVDPKPGKEARLRIAHRVSLGEKEIHIWFQNRRQKIRRRGDCLYPEDKDCLLDNSFPRVSDRAVVPTKTEVLAPAAPESSSSSIPNSTSITIADHAAPKSKIGGSEQKGVAPPARSRSSEFLATVLCDTPKILFHRAETEPPTRQFVVSTNSTRLSTSLSTSTTNLSDGSISTSPITASTEENFLPIPTACPRMSFDSTGAARLLGAEETSPSPPRTQPLAPTPFSTRQKLRRSFSAAGLSDYQANVRAAAETSNSPDALSSQGDTLAGVKQIPRIPRLPSGRSLDSRNWEFWCDSNARKEQAQKAEHEMSGNATNAISLLRSTSLGALGRSPRPVAGVLKPNRNLGNSQLVSDRGHKRHKVNASGKHRKTEHFNIHLDEQTKKTSTEDSLSLMTESDKENRLPRGRERGRTPRVATNVPAISDARRLGGVEIAAHDNNAESYAHHGGNSSSDCCSTSDDFSSPAPSSTGQTWAADEVAVRGLMSLSQGNWH